MTVAERHQKLDSDATLSRPDCVTRHVYLTSNARGIEIASC